MHTKMTTHAALRRLWPAAVLGALAGAAVFFWVYGPAPLNTGWDGWILNGYDEWDVQQHYAGWLLFRNSHWAFPLGYADTIAWPGGTAISYTDSLPWVSIALKLLRGALPATFQWFGWYTLGCFALQGAAGGLLAARGGKTRAEIALGGLLGGALFACLPTLWERAFRHTALASQWLFLFALFAWLESRAALTAGGKARGWAAWFPVLGFAAVGIHPYFLPLVLVCALLAAIDRGRLTHRWGRGSAAVRRGGGGLGGRGRTLRRARRGRRAQPRRLRRIFDERQRAVEPFLPRGGIPGAACCPPSPQLAGQYDGFNYLGLGVLGLLAAALALAFARGRAPAAGRRGLVAAQHPGFCGLRAADAVRAQQHGQLWQRFLHNPAARAAAFALRHLPLKRADVLPRRRHDADLGHLYAARRAGGPAAAAGRQNGGVLRPRWPLVLGVQAWDLSAVAGRKAGPNSAPKPRSPRRLRTPRKPQPSASATPNCWRPAMCGTTACAPSQFWPASRAWRPTWISRSPASTTPPPKAGADTARGFAGRAV